MSLLGITLTFLLFAIAKQCDNQPSIHIGFTIAKQRLISLIKLEGQLTLLQKGKTEFDFIGITSNGIDCI